MRSKVGSETEAPSDDPFYTVLGNAIYIPFETGTGGSSSVGSGGTSSSGSGPGSVVAETSGGITINLLFDAAAMAAPAAFRAGIAQAAAILASTISDKITVNLNIDYSGTGGGAAAGPDSGLFESYSSIRTDLINHATPGDTAFNALPNSASIQGQSNVAIWNAQLKLWGFLGANDTTTDDGSATFATDISSSLLVGVALHELTHALGRVPYGPQPDIFDLFRFTSLGVHLFQGGATAPAAYFSVDGGNTKLADFGQTSDSSDFLNSGVQGSTDPFNEFYNGSTIQGLTTVDKEMLDVLGFHLASNTPIVIEALGSTSLVQVGNNYFLDSISGGTGPSLKYAGAPVVAGQYDPYTPIGVEQTAGGYEVALKNSGTNQFSIWNTDSNGNFISFSVYSGTSAALESLETSFHQDLNGDGLIGPPTTVIEAFGSTSLVQVGDNYFLDSISGGTGPSLKYAGAPVVAGQYDPYTPIGVEQTAGGYEVALKNSGTNQFSIWNTDSNGNFISFSVYSGTSAALESLETSFHQDLNGDGLIGPPTTVIEAFGSTSLVQVGDNYFLDSISGGTGPSLKYAGAPVVAGQFDPYTPISAEQTAGGYEVALKNSGTNQFSIWNTDSNGNFISFSVYSGTSAALESLETSFHQDLNGDGLIGPPTTVIEAFGSTSLVQVGDNYFLDSISGGTGPSLKYAGAPVVAGQYDPYTPIGVEQTAGGYEVALKNSGTNQFSIWNTDSNGNFISFSVYSGTSTALESLETSFHQDLNGDGLIGPPTTVIEAFGSTSLVQVGDNYFLDSISGGTGPSLKYAGAPVVAGQFDPYTPIGVEQTAGGYEVALKNSGTNQFSIWNTDSNGNFISFSVYSGTSAALESLETSFHQDLNRDGVIGILAAQSASGLTPGPVSQAASATNDTFVFRPGIGADVVKNAASTDTIELAGFSSVTNNAQLAELLNDAQTGQSQSLFQWANSGHDTVISLGNHDSITLINVHIADLHASNFIIQ